MQEKGMMVWTPDNSTPHQIIWLGLDYLQQSADQQSFRLQYTGLMVPMHE
jgi:hypothetical protein